MAVNSLFVICGVFIMRKRTGIKDEGVFHIPFYPIPPLVYIAITIVTLIYLTIENPIEIAFCLGLITTGILGYFLTRKYSVDKK